MEHHATPSAEQAAPRKDQDAQALATKHARKNAREDRQPRLAVPQEMDDDDCFRRVHPRRSRQMTAPKRGNPEDSSLPKDSPKKEQTAQAPEDESSRAPQEESSLPKDSPKEERAAQAPPAKRPVQQEGETTSPKKAKTTTAEEQAAPREDQATQPLASTHTRKSEKEEGRPRVAVSQRSLAFADCFRRVHSLCFRDSTAPRRPSPEEVDCLTRFCVDQRLPVLSRHQFQDCRGAEQIPMGQGSYGRKFLNGKLDLVLKHAKNLKKFRTLLLEAVTMNLFVEHHSFQHLVGVFPQELCLVTRYAGRTLDHYIPSSRLKQEHRYSVMMQVCNSLQDFHRDGFAHNNLSLQSVCVKLTASGPKVALGEFGLAMVAGRRPQLGVAWTERSHFAPEICGAENPGCCGWQSDAYSVGKMMHQLFGSKQLPLLLNSWYVSSQAEHPSERRKLATLCESLEHQKIAQLRLGY